MDLALPFDLSEPDKAGHFKAGAFLGIVNAAALPTLAPHLPYWGRVGCTLILPTVVGLAKEIADATDPKHHDPDVHDLAATVAGGFVVALTFSIRF